MPKNLFRAGLTLQPPEANAVRSGSLLYPKGMKQNVSWKKRKRSNASENCERKKMPPAGEKRRLGGVAKG